MKKVLFVFVAVISMLAMTSCVDKEQCVGKWVSENVTEDGFTGNFYLDLNKMKWQICASKEPES